MRTAPLRVALTSGAAMSADRSVHLYRDLAENYDQHGEAQLRDRFLVLAADAALRAGQADEAERLRARLLEYNPHHLLKPFASLEEALKSRDVANYVSALRRSHPHEKAEQLLDSLLQKTVPPTAREQAAAPGVQPPATQPQPAFKMQEPGPTMGRPEPLKPRAAPPPPPFGQPRQVSADMPRPAPMPGKQPAARRPAATQPLRTAALQPRSTEPSQTVGSQQFESDYEGREQAPGAWICSLLFAFVLLAGVTFTAYLFYRPFFDNR